MAGLALGIIVYAVFFAWACGWLADKKGYDNVDTWQWLGLFFGLFALLVIGMSPERRGGPSEEYVKCAECGLRLPEAFYEEHRLEQHA